MTDNIAFELARTVRNGAFLRVVNYHNTRLCDAARFEREIAAFAAHFVPVTRELLDEFFATRRWPSDKPGLIPALYEGWRTHYDVYAPILEKYGFRGWFYVPAFFPDVPVPEQIAFCKPHGLRLFGREDYPDGRVCMNWDELRRLAEKHEICCHSGNHVPLPPPTDTAALRREIVESKRHMEARLGHEVAVFCSRSGESYADAPYTHPYFREAGYRYVVGNLKVEKIGG